MLDRMIRVCGMVRIRAALRGRSRFPAMPASFWIDSPRVSQIGVENGAVFILIEDAHSFAVGYTHVNGLIVVKDRFALDVFRPEGRAARPTAQRGRFALPPAVPGEYKLFAWEDFEGQAYMDPDLLRKYEELGTPVNVAPSSASDVEVKLIPASQQ